MKKATEIGGEYIIIIMLYIVLLERTCLQLFRINYITILEKCKGFYLRKV